MRTFETGATRDSETGKIDYDGYLSPLVHKRFGEYMREHQTQADGKIRPSDNWKKGIPLSAYMKSGWRHFLVWWDCHHGNGTQEDLENALCALYFNVGGYLHEVLRKKQTP
jgi:hypothetical protein